MQDHVSERFYDHERAEIYLDLLQSSLDHQQGSEQAWLLDSLTPVPVTPRHRTATRPHLAFRWFKLPQIPLPFLTWA